MKNNDVEQLIEEIVTSIPNYSKDDDNYELKVFSYIYVKLSYMLEFDYYAAELVDTHLSGFDREMAHENIIAPASDPRCLVKGKGLCSGFSRALQIILSKLNIESVLVFSETHVWNQVCLDGTWYNCDLTKDHEFVREGLKCPYFLKSNNDNSNMKEYKSVREGYHDCPTTISDEIQEKLIEEARGYVDNRESTETKDTPRFIQRIFDLVNAKQNVSRG